MQTDSQFNQNKVADTARMATDILLLQIGFPI
jgi:hypothetical protein